MVDVMAPVMPYPCWKVNGLASKGYITISVMSSGKIDVKQEYGSGIKALEVVQASTEAENVEKREIQQDDTYKSESHSDQLHLEDPQSSVLTSELMQAIKDVSMVQGPDTTSLSATSPLPQPVTQGDQNVVQEEKPFPLNLADIVRQITAKSKKVCEIRINLVQEKRNRRAKNISKFSTGHDGASANNAKSGFKLLTDENGKTYCSTCGKYVTSKAFKNHAVLIHKMETQHKCEVCGKCFPTQGSLKLHVNSLHSEQKPFQCSICNKSFKRKIILQYHMDTHSNEAKHHCNLCNERFITKDRLYVHRNKVHGNKHNKCVYCDIYFGSVEQLREHIKKVHVGAETPSNVQQGDASAPPLQKLATEADTTIASSQKRDNGNSTEESKRSIEDAVKTAATPDSHTSCVPESKPVDFRFLCTLCGKSLGNKHTLLQHIARTHRQEGKYSCNVCGRKCLSEMELRRHMPKHSDSRPYGCDVCSKTFKWKVNLTHHLDTHSSEVKYSCSLCGLRFKQRDKLSKHKSRVHRKHTGSHIVQCSVCGKVVKARSLKFHMTNNHGGQGKHKCEVCGKTWNLPSQLARHKVQHEASRSHHCDVCGRTFKTNAAVKTHKEIHTNDTSNQCVTCNRMFKSKRYLVKHLKTHEEKFSGDHKCTECSRSFESHVGLRKHVEIHDKSQELFPCPTCGKVFPGKYKLQRHIVVHSTSQFHCDQCNKSFATRSNLTSHMAVHTNDKKFKCDTCNKAFTRANALKAHGKAHANKREYRCKYCGKGFNTGSSLGRHILSHENIKQHQCDECGEGFTTSSNLTQHRRTHHLSQTLLQDEGNVAADVIEDGPAEIPFNALIEQVEDPGASDVVTFVITHPGLS